MKPLPVLLASLATTLLAACGGEERAQVAAGAGSEAVDAERAALLIRHYGCGSCHEIPQINSARGRVGPPLDGFGDRAYIAGILPNTQAELRRWIRQPQAVDPDTAMPNMGLSEDEADVVATWLHSL